MIIRYLYAVQVQNNPSGGRKECKLLSWRIPIILRLLSCRPHSNVMHCCKLPSSLVHKRNWAHAYYNILYPQQRQCRDMCKIWQYGRQQKRRRVLGEKFNYNKSIYIIVVGARRIATNRDKVYSLRLSGRFVIGQKKCRLAGAFMKTYHFEIDGRVTVSSCNRIFSFLEVNAK